MVADFNSRPLKQTHDTFSRPRLLFLFNSEAVDLMEHLFQGQLVLRTRCLECESFTERREDFQDISVPVLDDTTSSPDNLSEGEEFYTSPQTTSGCTLSH